MRYFIGVLIGYFLGCLNPTHLLSIIKDIDMRKSGTGNLGATNAMLTMGKWLGIAVMLFDIAKAFIPVLIFKLIFPYDHVLILTIKSGNACTEHHTAVGNTAVVSSELFQ